MTDRVPGLGDELLITWIMNWNIHALFTDPVHIFNANIFYPYQNVLAFSDIFFTSTAIGLIPSLTMNQPVFIFNFTLLFSLITLGFFTYLLVQYLTKNSFASVISGTLIAFSTYTMTRLSVVQMIGIEWVPLSLLFYLQFLEKKKFGYLVWTVIFFLIQIYNSFLPGYFLLLCYGAITAVYWFRKKISSRIFFSMKVLLLGFISLLLLVPILIPYQSVAKEFAFSRDIRDAIHFGNRPEYSLYPSEKTRLKGFLMSTFYAHDTGPFTYEGYIGGTFLFLLLFVIVYRFFIRKKTLGIPFTVFSLIALSSFVLSLGPALQWGGKVLKVPFIIPLPYAVFYYLIPGFKGMRNSARWEFLALFALSVLIGIVLADFWKKQSVRTQFLLAILICLVTIMEYPIPLQLERVPRKEQFPPIYREVATLPKETVIIEMPLFSWRMAPHSSQEFLREYYATSHFRKMVNGYSGFSPIPWEKQAEMLMTSFPSDMSILYLREKGVQYIIVHQADYLRIEKIPFTDLKRAVPTWEKVEKGLSENPAVKLLYHTNGEYIYEIL